jgi:hypothetical protein
VSLIRVPPGKILLHFSGAEEPALEEVTFSYDPALGEITSIRGRSAGAGIQSGNFAWSPAVKALTVLLLRTSEHALRGGTIDSTPPLEGTAGSLASSLDYAFAKNPAWLSDMFGCDTGGEPYARKLILRTNPERKRPGPVVLSINRYVLDPKLIRVLLDGLDVVDPATLREMANRIEQSRLLSNVRSDTPRTVIIERGKVFQAKRSRSKSADIPQIPTGTAIYHHLLSRSDIERDFLRSVQCREIGRKFAFIGEGAVSAWLDICESDRYQHFVRSFAAMNSNAGAIAERCAGTDCVIAIWPGNGRKEAALIRAFNQVRPTSFYFVDTSQEMLGVALQECRDIPAHSEAFVADFMLPGTLASIRQRVGDGNTDSCTFLLLGNTSCSHPQAEFFHRLRSAMKARDKVVFDTTVIPDNSTVSMDELVNQWISKFDIPEFHRQFALSVTALGLSIEEGEVEIDYSVDRLLPALYRVEHFYRFTRNTRRTLLGEELLFSKGERILLSYFYQFTRPAMEQLITAHGLLIEDVYVTEGDLLQLICSRGS